MTILQRLIQSSRDDKVFGLKVCELVGLDHTATRQEILAVISRFVQHVGLARSRRQPTQNASRPNGHPKQTASVLNQ